MAGFNCAVFKALAVNIDKLGGDVTSLCPVAHLTVNLWWHLRISVTFSLEKVVARSRKYENRQGLRCKEEKISFQDLQDLS